MKNRSLPGCESLRRLCRCIAAEPPPTRLPRPQLFALMLVAAAVAGAIHVGNLLAVGHELGCNWSFDMCREGEFLLAPDSSTYEEVADSIRVHGIFRTSYLYRGPGYPAVLAAVKTVSGSIMPALWIVPLVAALAAAALVWVGARLAGSLLCGAATGFLLCVWPAVYQFEALILTDAVHGILFPIAIALTLAWVWSERSAYLVFALVVWLTMQAIRPTFFVLAVVWPLVLLKTNANRRYRRVSLVAWVCTIIVPLLIVISNTAHHGLVTTTAKTPETLALYGIPRLQEDLGMGDFRTLRDEARQRYQHLELKDRVALQRSESRSWILDHPLVTIKSFGRGIAGQILWPPRPWSAERLADLYPAWSSLPRAVMPVYWVSAFAGLAVLFRSRPRTALLLAAFFPLVMLPASMSHFVEGRLRFPLDLLAMPLIVVAFQAGFIAVRRRIGLLPGTRI